MRPFVPMHTGKRRDEAINKRNSALTSQINHSTDESEVKGSRSTPTGSEHRFVDCQYDGRHVSVIVLELRLIKVTNASRASLKSEPCFVERRRKRAIWLFLLLFLLEIFFEHFQAVCRCFY